MGSGVGAQSNGENMRKDNSKSHLETYYCRGFLSCICMYEKNLNGVTIKWGI